ncbi:DUF5990 family protein [Actinacidiphila bryophytorum]|uniref:DUF5990 family protein n=1 Tax=Actinacidiphila bryophytorum TaxID=1436133 RepID=UPI0035569C4C
MSREAEELNRRLLRARDAMDRAYAGPLDVRAVAAVAHISPAHFSRCFRTVFGETPHSYLQRRRVERSMFLLMETDRSVTEICCDVGFTSLGTFSRTFRRIVGQSPSGYREGTAGRRGPGGGVHDGGMLIRIEGSGLPGRECGPSPDSPQGYRDIHVGVQRRGRPGELLGLHPGDAASAAWELEATASPVEGGWDVRGPYVQGPPGGRFVYLAWGTVDADGAFTMFRRAKLLFDGVGADVLAAAVADGVLVGRLGLSDAKGHPLCAAVRPPAVTWSASRA